MGVPKKIVKIPCFFEEKKRQKSVVPKKIEKITDFLKIREKNQGVPKDKTQRNPN